MNDARKKLTKAARQLLEGEQLMGGNFLPKRRNPFVMPAVGRALPDTTPPGATAAPFAAVPVHTGAPASPIDQLPPMTTQQKQAALQKLIAEEILPCNECRLCSAITHKVPGEGNVDAAVMFVGEGPGQEEDLQGRPFVGKAGQMLDKWIAGMGLARQEVFIGNVVKCRPPGNRTPLPDEMAACLPHLLKQLQIIRPKVIVTLGNPATQTLLQTKIGITKLRGQWQKLPNHAPGLEAIPVMPTFHPSYLLRSYTQENRKFIWDDLQKVMQFLGLKRK
jgi:DNA polymerase